MQLQDMLPAIFHLEHGQVPRGIDGGPDPIQAAFVSGDLVIVTTATNTGTGATSITLNDYPYNPLTGTFGTTPTSHPISGLTISCVLKSPRSPQNG